MHKEKLMTCTIRRYFYDGQIKEDDMGRTYCTHGKGIKISCMYENK
jgi:hypothetical protein